jgi:hypothetical protein
MTLPGAELAVVDIAKLRDYCLNQSHHRGRHKDRVFAAALNLSPPDAEFLREELLRAARETVATEGDADQYGERYILDFEIARNDRRTIAGRPFAAHGSFAAVKGFRA